eukprot:5732663-Prymnesium_polylepis.1
MVLLLEESQPVASADGWIKTVTIDQVEQTPRGTRQVLRSVSYNFKRGRRERVRQCQKEAARREARCEAARLRIVRPGEGGGEAAKAAKAAARAGSDGG